MTELQLEEGILYYDKTGAGIAVVFLHAGVADHRMWDEQLEIFSTQHTVVRCDLRGFGESKLPNGPFAYHEDILSLVKVLDLPPVWLVGSSFGAQVAVDFYLSYPELVRGLILAAPVVSGFEPNDEALDAFNEREGALLEAGNIEDATELNLSMWVDGPYRSIRDVDSSLRSRVSEMQRQSFSQPYPENVSLKRLDPPAIERLSEIQVPLLIISGELDVPAFTRLAETIAGQVPQAKKIVVPDVAHLINMEVPRLFSDLVMDFISSPSNQGTRT